MPALIHNSQNFASRGIAILDQSYEEQPSGLVRVRVEYALTESSAANINSMFRHDAAPPVFPGVYPRANLQRSSLFLEDHSVEKAFGQWRVLANYAGARVLQAGFRGFVTRENEARVTPPRRVGSITLSVKFVAQLIKTTIASVHEAVFDTERESREADVLILRARYGSISFPGIQSASEDAVQTIISFERLPSPMQIFREFRPTIETSTSIDNITTSVIVATTTRDVAFLQGS
jgi:hypothetical protein